MSEVPEKQDKPNKILIALLTFSILANAGLMFMLFDEKGKTEQLMGENSEITVEKNDLELELNGMLLQYDSLSSDNDTLNAQLASERTRVEEMIQKVKNGNWTIYKLKKETESLRTIMKSFVHTIDSLNTANIELMAENKNIKGELGKERDKSTLLESEKTELAEKVKIGERLQAVFIESYGQKVKNNNIHKRTEKARSVEKIKTCVTIGENDLAKVGKKIVYARIIGPSGKVLTLNEDKANMFKFDGVRGLYSVKKEINYENKEIDICLYWDVKTSVTSGKYVVYTYADNHEIGSTEFILD
tara:strand:+ start:2306 stop:3211 length:906 start_codon:yes stop_codon:yes gene_type:complete